METDKEVDGQTVTVPDVKKVSIKVVEVDKAAIGSPTAEKDGLNPKQEAITSVVENVKVDSASVKDDPRDINNKNESGMIPKTEINDVHFDLHANHNGALTNTEYILNIIQNHIEPLPMDMKKEHEVKKSVELNVKKQSKNDSDDDIEIIWDSSNIAGSTKNNKVAVAAPNAVRKGVWKNWEHQQKMIMLLKQAQNRKPKSLKIASKTNDAPRKSGGQSFRSLASASHIDDRQKVSVSPSDQNIDYEKLLAPLWPRIAQYVHANNGSENEKELTEAMKLYADAINQCMPVFKRIYNPDGGDSCPIKLPIDPIEDQPTSFPSFSPEMLAHLPRNEEERKQLDLGVKNQKLAYSRVKELLSLLSLSEQGYWMWISSHRMLNNIKQNEFERDLGLLLNGPKPAPKSTLLGLIQNKIAAALNHELYEKKLFPLLQKYVTEKKEEERKRHAEWEERREERRAAKRGRLSA